MILRRKKLHFECLCFNRESAIIACMSSMGREGKGLLFPCYGVKRLPVKRWNVRKPDEKTVQNLARELGLSQVLLRILVSRGYQEQEAVKALLNEQNQLTDPFRLTDMEKAVERIHKALENGERIVIYGDYDCDGIMSTAMLYRYFESEGADIAYYIPQRDSEGYGLNQEALRRIYEAGASLVITVDNGISALEEAEYAKSLGLDLIVTDHHHPRATLPNALAVIDPHRSDDESGCEYLCGAGVAFKLISALEAGASDWVLDLYGDLLAVATVADIVPLVGENREIVRRGMELLQNTENPGLFALIQACGMGERILSCENVVFGLAPRINSAGRFDRVDSAVELFVSEGEELDSLAQEINELNEHRKKVEDKIVSQILERYDRDRETLGRRVSVIHGEGWYHGVVGIVASRMVERFGKPCIVLSVEGDMSRGSARSVEGFSIINAISACGHLLTRYGGHNQAAGMTLPTKSLDQFAEAINQWAAENYPEMPALTLSLDCAVTPKQLSVQELTAVTKLEPFGCGNETPVFYISKCILQGIYPIGEGKHLRLRFCQDNMVFYAIYFGMTQQSLPYSIGDVVDLAVTADAGEWNGEMRVSIKIRDLRLSGMDYESLYHSDQIYERIMRGEQVECHDSIIPSRDDIAVVYRYLRTVKKISAPDEMIYSRLCKQLPSFCKLKIAVDVLEEMALIDRENSGGVRTISVRQNPKKVNLADSDILKKLERTKAVNCS